jgi:hypothetical protein
MNWPDITACSTWSLNTTQVVPGAKATSRCGQSLPGHVGLGAVVQAQHQVVELGAALLGDVQGLQQPAGAGQGRLMRAGRCGRSPGSPRPRARRAAGCRVHVGEDAQQAGALGRVGREGVHMQAGVVLAPAGLAAFDRDRAVGGVGDLQLAGVVGEQALRQAVAWSRKRISMARSSTRSSACPRRHASGPGRRAG